MKSKTLKLVIFALVSTLFIACGAKKGGCGLTSDAQKIEQTISKTQTTIIAEAK
ncbi:hypothetical protein SAMN05444411_102187 [Lutibacter oricola]|uniref:Entericidin EcnA/B family protein n=1 Tax=Lutibacter oricola TaxID=762486 RepID=A0A1H2WFC2_9FLAO|nr:hypothetical protein [Lutibacter oricola]SDW79383.1 hypothetical protein SAMN05444411_102187 [Lutibacter oricola]